MAEAMRHPTSEMFFLRDEGFRVVLLSTTLLAGGVVLVAIQPGSVLFTFQSNMPSILVWISIAIVVDFFPVVLGRLRVTLDMPVLISVSLLYPPPVAWIVGWLAAFDVRELRGRVPLTHAVFNRSQIALSVFLASLAFHSMNVRLADWPLALLGTAVALVVDVATNLGLVATYFLTRDRLLSSAREGLRIGSLGLVLAVHVGYGALALVLARLFADVGEWSVIAFLVPFLAAQQLLARNQQLVAYSARLQENERLLARALDRTADERKDERRNMAGEIHDEVLPSLAHIQTLGRFIRNEVSAGTKAAKDVDDLVKVSDQSIDCLRALMHELRESPLGRGGLIPTLQSLAQDLKLESGIRIEVAYDEGIELSGELQVAAYQVAREALSNAIKHSRASLVRLSVRERGGRLHLAVQDDGTGFDFKAVDTSRHFGISLMRERVRRAGGRLRIAAGANQGSILRADFPLTANGQPG
jgi:signal transduction histidine kinase